MRAQSRLGPDALPVNVPQPFSTPREKNGLQQVLSDTSTSVAYVGAGVLVALSALLGYIVGGRAPANLRNASKLVGAAAGVSAVAVVITKLQESREEAAAVDLYNELVKKGDPSTLTREEVDEIEKKYNVELATTLVSEMKSMYDQYLETIIPQGDIPLTGKEPEKLITFKGVLGLSDEDAAAVHMDVGRRLARSRFEVGTKRAQAEQRKAFQKWLYISYRVFGDRKAAFLLPLVRVFGLTQSQIMVARRDNAKSIFQAKIDEMAAEQGGMLKADRWLLEQLKQYQVEVQLEDEVAEEVLQAALQAFVEQRLQKALENIRARMRVKDYSPAMKELHGILEFNTALEALAKDGSPSLPRGLGRVTIHGSGFQERTSTADLRDLYRVFLEESLKNEGQFTVKLEQDINALMVVVGLGPKESASIREEVTSTIYRRLLREEVQSGRLDAAPSKAAVLEGLCKRLMFKPELAALMHKSIYKQKLESALEQHDKVTEDDARELTRLRALMCIPESDIKEVVRETCGGRLRTAIGQALSAGIDNFSSDDIESVRKVIVELRLDQEMSLEALDESARKVFMQYITNSRLKRNRLEAAKELKKMIFFSNIVVAPLLEEVKGKNKAEGMQETLKEIADAVSKAAETEETSAEVASTSDTPEATDGLKEAQKVEEQDSKEAVPSTLDKAQKAASSFSSGDQLSSGVKMSSQKEITLAKDLETTDRVEIYRNYLLYCMSGDVVAMPMGGTVVLERDMDEFGRLSQLGDILGLSPLDVMKVHQDLAEQAFRQQVKAVMAGGDLTKEKADSLTEMRQKMGLAEEAAQKIIKGVQNERLAAGLQSAKAMGDLSLQKLLDMKESGVEIENFTSTEYRRRLFQQEVERAMSDGKGTLDEEYFFETLPTSLHLEKDKARKVITDVAATKKGLQMVQAMSDLRMRKFDAVVEDINNFLVCNQVIDANGHQNGKGVWDRREEVLDLYSVYYWKVKDDEKLSEMQRIFDISDSEAKSLRDVVDSGGLRWAEEVKDEELFF